MKRSYLGLIFVFLLASFGFAAADDTQSKQREPDPVIKSLLFGETWGSDKARLLAAIKKHFDADWREKAADLDAYEVDAEIRKSQMRYEKVLKSFTELDQGAATYLASPLKGEFGLGLGQSLLKVRLAHGDRYLFFQNGRLSKVVEVIPVSPNKSVDSFRIAQAQRYKMKQLPDCGPTTTRMAKKHAGGQTCMIDKSLLFNAYVVRITDPKADWKGAREQNATKEEEQGLPDIFSDDSKTDSDAKAESPKN